MKLLITFKTFYSYPILLTIPKIYTISTNKLSRLGKCRIDIERMIYDFYGQYSY